MVGTILAISVVSAILTGGYPFLCPAVRHAWPLLVHNFYLARSRTSGAAERTEAL